MAQSYCTSSKLASEHPTTLECSGRIGSPGKRHRTAPTAGTRSDVNVSLLADETKPRPSFRHRCFLSKDVGISVVSSNLLEDVLEVVPLIEHSFNPIFLRFKPESTGRSSAFLLSSTPRSTSSSSLLAFCHYYLLVSRRRWMVRIRQATMQT